MNNVNKSGNVKSLQIGHKAKQSRKNARSPITVTERIEAGGDISHLLSTLTLSLPQNDRYINIMASHATHINPRFNAVRLILLSRSNIEKKLEWKSPQYKMKKAEATHKMVSMWRKHLLILEEEKEEGVKPIEEPAESSSSKSSPPLDEYPEV